MTLRLIISGTNSEIPADAFQTIGRGWQSQGERGVRRFTHRTLSTVLEVPTDPRGGGRPLSMTAADLGFWFLCALIFVAAPVYMVLA